MCLLSSVAFLFSLDLNDALWFARRALKLVAVMPTYDSEVSPQVTVAWYTMSLRRHSPFNGQVAFLGQLQSFSSSEHRIRIHRRATRVGASEVFEAAHVALRTLLAFCQPVNCIFWPIGMLNWLVAASKLHKHRVTCCTAEWPFYSFLILCF